MQCTPSSLVSLSSLFTRVSDDAVKGLTLHSEAECIAPGNYGIFKKRGGHRDLTAVLSSVGLFE